MANNNQSNHQYNRRSYFLIKYLLYYKICLCVELEHNTLKQDHATGREAALARVPCYHSTEQQNILSDGGKKGLGNKDAQDSIWGILCQDEDMDEHQT